MVESTIRYSKSGSSDTASPKLLASVSAAAKTSRRISSICTGVFALADAALLGNRRVTTHWLFAEELKPRFPDVRLEADRIYIVDRPIWTAAGNRAGIDLTLHMLESDYGYDLARAVARILVVDQRRSGGQSQHSALLDMNPKSERIQQALAYARRKLRRCPFRRRPGPRRRPRSAPIQSRV
jgi:transcriptional regulator GlxA family with amidase domain